MRGVLTNTVGHLKTTKSLQGAKNSLSGLRAAINLANDTPLPAGVVRRDSLPCRQMPFIPASFPLKPNAQRDPVHRAPASAPAVSTSEQFIPVHHESALPKGVVRRDTLSARKQPKAVTPSPPPVASSAAPALASAPAAEAIVSAPVPVLSGPVPVQALPVDWNRVVNLLTSYREHNLEMFVVKMHSLVVTTYHKLSPPLAAQTVHLLEGIVNDIPAHVLAQFVWSLGRLGYTIFDEKQAAIIRTCIERLLDAETLPVNDVVLVLSGLHRFGITNMNTSPEEMHKLFTALDKVASDLTSTHFVGVCFALGKFGSKLADLSPATASALWNALDTLTDSSPFALNVFITLGVKADILTDAQKEIVFKASVAAIEVVPPVDPSHHRPSKHAFLPLPAQSDHFFVAVDPAKRKAFRVKDIFEQLSRMGFAYNALDVRLRNYVDQPPYALVEYGEAFEGTFFRFVPNMNVKWHEFDAAFREKVLFRFMATENTRPWSFIGGVGRMNTKISDFSDEVWTKAAKDLMSNPKCPQSNLVTLLTSLSRMGISEYWQRMPVAFKKALMTSIRASMVNSTHEVCGHVIKLFGDLNISWANIPLPVRNVLEAYLPSAKDMYFASNLTGLPMLQCNWEALHVRTREQLSERVALMDQFTEPSLVVDTFIGLAKIATPWPMVHPLEAALVQAISKVNEHSFSSALWAFSSLEVSVNDLQLNTVQAIASTLEAVGSLMPAHSVNKVMRFLTLTCFDAAHGDAQRMALLLRMHAVVVQRFQQVKSTFSHDGPLGIDRYFEMLDVLPGGKEVMASIGGKPQRTMREPTVFPIGAIAETTAFLTSSFPGYEVVFKQIVQGTRPDIGLYKDNVLQAAVNVNVSPAYQQRYALFREFLYAQHYPHAEVFSVSFPDSTVHEEVLKQLEADIQKQLEAKGADRAAVAVAAPEVVPEVSATAEAPALAADSEASDASSSKSAQDVTVSKPKDKSKAKSKKSTVKSKDVSDNENKAESKDEDKDGSKDEGKSKGRSKAAAKQTPFDIFCEDKLEQIKEENPDVPRGKINKILKDLWTSMDAPSRLPYFKEAKLRTDAVKAQSKQ